MKATESSSARSARRFPWLTLLVLVANVGVYVWQGSKFGHFLRFSDGELMQLGANVAALSATGDHWRYLASLFLHASVVQLLWNMAALALIGTALEMLVARWQWLLLYLAGGAFAGFVSASMNFDVSATTIFLQTSRMLYLSVGAAGAVMSLAGALVLFALLQATGGQEEDDGPREMGWLFKGALLFAVLHLGAGLVSASSDNAAQVGGLVFGLLVGAVLAAPKLYAGLPGLLAAGLVPLVMLGATVFHLAHEIERNPTAGKLRRLAIQQRDEAAGAERPHKAQFRQADSQN